ncbi:F-box family protein [Rhynchospora pubera]|uniref:F-box family protein n=1 Tax=Rhynchospora pubera TaxID=906938 RepID=A0AAV8BYV5_9POAL|nr:F-box family protein [Rhynchospora pubera]
MAETIVYRRKRKRSKNPSDIAEDVRFKTLSTDNGHEKMIVYKRRNITKMQIEDHLEAGREVIMPTGERHEREIISANGKHGQIIGHKGGTLRGTQLNDLPEDILCSIISRLPLGDAVRTSILSTKLRRIWASHPNLTFTKRAMFPKSKIKGGEQIKFALIEGMHAVLKQHRGNGVERIFLQALLDQSTSSALNTCVKFAVTSGTTSLSLLLSPERPYCFPTYLFDLQNGSRSVLEELYLKYVSLRIPAGFTGFKHLKRLNLDCMYDIVADELQALLKNCLLLEVLCINVVYKFDKLVISQALSHLKYLSLTACLGVKTIEVAAANVERFEYEGSSDNSIVFPQPLKNVKYASVQWGAFNSHVGEFVLSVLPRSFPGLETLVWKTYGVEMDGLPNCLGRFQCLKSVHIELCAPVLACDVLSLAALLDAAPSLESFFLKLIGFINVPYSGIEEFRRLPSSPHHHIISVGIKEFTCSRDQIELVEYILENATALEHMIIKTKIGCYKDAAIHSPYIKKDKRVVIL